MQMKICNSRRTTLLADRACAMVACVAAIVAACASGVFAQSLDPLEEIHPDSTYRLPMSLVLRPATSESLEVPPLLDPSVDQDLYDNGYESTYQSDAPQIPEAPNMFSEAYANQYGDEDSGTQKNVQLHRIDDVAVVSHEESIDQPLRIGGHRRGVKSGVSPSSMPRRDTGLSKVVSSLCLVMGVLFGLLWFSRKLGMTRSSRIPDEVVQVLGQCSLGPRQQACIVRFGSKMLALSVTPNGVEPLGELDDLQEVESLTQLCVSHDSKTVSPSLRRAVDQYAATRNPNHDG